MGAPKNKRKKTIHNMAFLFPFKEQTIYFWIFPNQFLIEYIKSNNELVVGQVRKIRRI